MIVLFTQEITDESGSALMYTVYLSLLLGTLIAVLIAARLAVRLTVASTIELEQTRYAAEAGIVLAMKDLESSDARLAGHTYDWLGYEIGVDVATFGAYLKMISSTDSRNHVCSTKAYIGTDPQALKHTAIHLADADKRLFVTGSTEVVGNIVIPGGSLERGSIDGRSFRGEIIGEVQSEGSPRPLPFGQSVSMYLSTIDSLLSSDIPPMTTAQLESRSLNEPLVFLSSTDITLTDSGWIPDGSIIATNGILTIGGGVASDFIIYYGRDGVILKKSKAAGGQFFSRQFISVTDSSHVPFPSIAFLTGNPATAQILVDSTSMFDGTLAFRADEDLRTRRIPNISIASGALVRGAIVNDAATEMSGTLFGSVATRSFFFYQSPTTYINWLRNTEIDVSKRPKQFTTGVLEDVPLSVVQSHTSCKRI